MNDSDYESLVELRAALKAEREGAAKIEQALAAALADNSILAAELHKNDNPESSEISPPKGNATDIYPIDSFLAD